MEKISNVYAIYIDRAFQLAEQSAVTNDSLLDWYCEGDIERVIDMVELGEKVAIAIPHLGDVALSEFCYQVIEYELRDWLLQLFSTNMDAPGHDDIIERIKQLHAEKEATCCSL
jgi:hypothetical protein